MADRNPTYDLMLLLDPAAEEAQRAKILADVKQAIATGGGELLLEQDWGERALAYPIEHRTEAEYHLLQLHATPALLAELQRTLRIADGVTRFRLIKLAPGTPPAPEVRPRGAVPAGEGQPREAVPAAAGADSEPAPEAA